MTNCLCLLQEGQIPEDVVSVLADGITQVVRKHQLGSEVNFSWVTIPKGQGWTAGELSTSSVVTLMAPAIEQSVRVQVLEEVCGLWTDKTGCHINEIIASVIPVE